MSKSHLKKVIWSILMKPTKKLDILDTAFFLAPRGLAGFFMGFSIPLALYGTNIMSFPSFDSKLSDKSG